MASGGSARDPTRHCPHFPAKRRFTFKRTLKCSHIFTANHILIIDWSIRCLLEFVSEVFIYEFQIRRDGGAALDDFRPIPIPLNEWREVRSSRDGSRIVAPAAPARYWEDALRHSVYLTLVRDKIDQLIARGVHEDPLSEFDDRDLWDKVKRAPFKRTESEEPVMLGDVAVMAKGKLMEEHHSFKFTEDDKFKDKCTNDKCMDGVKALWSVKREKMRDEEAFPGQYHYELTFSVVTPKKTKPYDQLARTFTVRESVPEKVIETPKENRYYQMMPVQAETPRNERVIWFHKNIAPTGRNQARQHHNSLDRLFSSLFTDDDEELPHPRYKPKQHISQVYQQFSKVGHVGAPSENQHKKLYPYGNKPMSYKYSRPIPPPPQPHVQHHYLDIDAIGVVSNPYLQDPRYRPAQKHGKTQRPPVLPIPPKPILPQNFTIETTTKLKPNMTEETTTQPPQPEHVTPHRTHNKHRPSAVKISYASDHVRPPVYNAPPGVFVTMDKKPFKPMPPLRLVHPSKYHKHTRPTDFRPSPQVLDIQFSEPDPLFDSAFRPITVNYANSNTTEKAVVTTTNNHFRKSNTTDKKPPKKHEIIKAQVTTPAPEIITAHSVDDSDAEWTNVLGAFAKTTPMAAEKEKTTATETTTPLTTSTISTTSKTTTTTIAPYKKRTTTTTEAPTTTPKPKKRTRPPPKFKKPEKIKKHKRITTTTSPTVIPQILTKQDLIPQASSASVTANINITSSSMTTTSTTSTTTTTTQATTTPVLTTTTPVPTTTTSTTTTTQPTTTTMSTKPTPTQSEHIKRNRYRQSTLKYRSTSGKDDKKDDKPRTIVPPTGNFPPRRKGSKFQDNIPSSTPKNTDMQYGEDGREDHIVSPYKSKHTSTEESVTPQSDTTTEKTTTTTTASYEEVANNIYITNGPLDYFEEDDSDVISNDGGGEEQESRENSELVPSTVVMTTPSEKTNEITEADDETFEVTEETVSTTPKSKSKCKKKKNNNLSNTQEESKPEITDTVSTESKTTTATSTTTTTTTTESTTTPDFFQEIFGGFTFDDSPGDSKDNSSVNKLEEQESINQEQFMKAEDDIEDFFEAFEGKDKHPDRTYEDTYEYDDKEPILDDHVSSFQNEDDHVASRDSNDEETYDDYPERPYSLLELMAME